MKTKWMLRTAVLAALLVAGISTVGAQVSLGISIGAPPPPRVVHVHPARPGPGYIWVDGYWYPVGGRYSWHDGYWTLPPYEGALWVGPHYEGGHFYGGYWNGDHGRFDHDHHWDHEHDRDGNRYHGDHDHDDHH